MIFLRRTFSPYFHTSNKNLRDVLKEASLDVLISVQIDAIVKAWAQWGGDTGARAPLEEFWGGTAPPRLPRKRKKSIKSGLKTRLERFKNQKFSYPP